MATFTIYCRKDWKDASGENPLYINYNHEYERDRFATGITINLTITRFDSKKCLLASLSTNSKTGKKVIAEKQTEINRVAIQLRDSIKLCETVKAEPRPVLIKSLFNAMRSGQPITAEMFGVSTLGIPTPPNILPAQGTQHPTLRTPQFPQLANTLMSEPTVPSFSQAGVQSSPLAAPSPNTDSVSSDQTFSPNDCEIIDNVFHWYRLFLLAKEVDVDTGIKSYRSTLVKLLEAYPVKKLPFMHLTTANLNALKAHLLKQIDLRGTTIHKHFNNIKIFIKWVKDDEVGKGIVIPDGIKTIKIKPKYNDPIGLSTQEFMQFYEADLSFSPELQRTRDVFVFGVSIGGPRHGDLQKIGKYLRDNAAQLREQGISYFEGKTGNAHKGIELNRFGFEVLEKYDYVFPHVPSNYRMNQNLKAIGRRLKWRQLKDVPRFDLKGRVTSIDKVPLQEIFSTKFMRKVAISMDARMGVPVQVGMKRSGHTTFNAYRRYLDINNDDLAAVNTKWDVLHSNVKPPQLAIAALGDDPEGD